jgi:hypothetical protein
MIVRNINHPEGDSLDGSKVTIGKDVLVFGECKRRRKFTYRDGLCGRSLPKGLVYICGQYCSLEDAGEDQEF